MVRSMYTRHGASHAHRRHGIHRMKYTPCDRPHSNDAYEADCAICSKGVNVHEPHYITMTEMGRFAVHIECVVAEGIAEAE